ncbi:hypothetical protein EXIGLDRAFT_127178 [Exidia glandulosa HHB12029]|uniref:DUF6533 domain-containing protein n=1 Tax=Exidia glandulosa HHB12029 TaxID=1314781 RepID=A0A166AAU3_EXIGL|nr:hypothetical protein EXIGLDRAFT_127178 [Exidia glandulosa HHB12029]
MPPNFVPTRWDYAAQVACIALFFYDWVLTFSDEVELIWYRQSWRAGAFFLPLRYFAFAGMCFTTYMFTLHGESETVNRVESWVKVPLMIVIIILVQVILQIRVYIMYNRSPLLLRLNAGLFICEVGATLGLLIVLSQRIKFRQIIPGCEDCVVSDWPKEIGFCYVVPLVFESYLAALMVSKSWRNRKLLNELEGKSLFYVLIRDSVVYFVLVASALAVSMIHSSWRREEHRGRIRLSIRWEQLAGHASSYQCARQRRVRRLLCTRVLSPVVPSSFTIITLVSPALATRTTQKPRTPTPVFPLQYPVRRRNKRSRAC